MITSLNQLDLTKQYTYADYLTWTFEESVELIRGFIFKMSPAPSKRHQDLSGNIFREISVYIKNRNCKVYSAPFDVRLTRKKSNQEVMTVVQPDICVICDPSILDEKGCNGAPDWIVEILSPATSKKDVKDKFALYEETGVKEYWMASPELNFLDVFYLIDGKYQFMKKYAEDDVVEVLTLPGLVIDLKDVFEAN